uniref:Ig-like domain-containing protein n=1 Tax=Paramormyrops kingsleyae TaxID=1676925 RepID=A0A3B3SMR4_9TELE
MHCVSTVSRVSVQRGGSVTIPCFYEDRYETHVKYWCRGYNVSSCSPIVHSDSPQEGKVSIRDDPNQQVFTVTINNLTAGDSGYYSCGVKISEGSDIPVHINVSQTTTARTSTERKTGETGRTGEQGWPDRRDGQDRRAGLAGQDRRDGQNRRAELAGQTRRAGLASRAGQTGQARQAEPASRADRTGETGRTGEQG